VSELQIADLHKSFGATPVLTGLDIEVPAGSLTAILGSSGSGKTTLLRVLAGLQPPDRGAIAIGGRAVDGVGGHVPAERRRIGYVPQEGALFPHLTVQANVTFGLPRAQRREGSRRLLETVGLTGLEKRYPHQLSGGQQQRVALARALAVRPEIVLLDEPFASLDANLRASVREDVHAILRETHTTTLLVTHDQDEALSIADQVAVLRDGKIAQYATPQELYMRPIDVGLARFVGEANLIQGVMVGEHVRTALGTLPASWREGHPPKGASSVSVLIRPEQIDLHLLSDGQITDPAGGDAPRKGRISRAGYHGHDSLLHVQIDDSGQGEQSLIVRTQGNAQLPTGAQVTITVRDTVLIWPLPASEG
jgi:iron(III) transport system ATP-binding protein